MVILLTYNSKCLQCIHWKSYAYPKFWWLRSPVFLALNSFCLFTNTYMNIRKHDDDIMSTKLLIIKEPTPDPWYYGVYTSRITPLNPPDVLGGNNKSSSLPFIRAGLGWGKTLVNQLFQTCVDTVALVRGG
jgi:hypothetical protein